MGAPIGGTTYGIVSQLAKVKRRLRDLETAPFDLAALEEATLPKVREIEKRLDEIEERLDAGCDCSEVHSEAEPDESRLDALLMTTPEQKARAVLEAEAAEGVDGTALELGDRE